MADFQPKSARDSRPFVWTFPESAGSPVFNGGVEDGNGVDRLAAVKDGLGINDKASLSGDTLDISGQSGFSAGSVKIVKCGDMVTITALTEIDHDSFSNISTASGFIPAEFRPTSLVGNIYDVSGVRIRRVRVSANGTLTFTYYDWSGDTIAATGAGNQVTLTYNV